MLATANGRHHRSERILPGDRFCIILETAVGREKDVQALNADFRDPTVVSRIIAATRE
jgi:hypothetical protein